MLRESSFSEKWPVVPLGDVVDFLDNLRKPVTASDRVEGEYLYYGANGVQGTINNYIFDEPLVLLAEDGGHFGNPDRDIAYIASGKYWVNNHAHVLKPKKNYDLNFLYRVLQRYDVTAYIKGATRAKLTKGDALNIKMPLPPLEEQKRIAAILDKADAIRRKRQQAIKLADDFLRSVFLEMFGDPVTNPKGLPIASIGNLCGVATGSTPSRQVEEYYGGNIPWVKTTEVDGYVIYETEECISDSGLKNSNCKLNPIGSIVLAMYGQGKTRGKVGVLGVEAATNQACAVIKPSSKVMMEYLYIYLQLSYESLRSLGQGAGQPNLNLSIVKNFPVLLPNENEQRKFVKISEAIKNLKQKSVNAVDKSADSFQSLSQKAFSGQL